MKKLITAAFFLFSIISFAQKDVEEIAVKTLNKQDKSLPNFKHFNKILDEFQKTRKISIDHLKKDNIGIAFELSEDNKELDVFPARFTFDEDKISLTAIRSKSTGKPTEDMVLFTQKFMNGDLDLGSTKIFKYLMNNAPPAEGTYADGEGEYVIEEPLSLSFVRGNEDWMYVISIDNKYAVIDHPRILMYAFPLSFGKPIFKTIQKVEKQEKSNSDEDREKHPLFHDFRTDDIRLGLENLLKFEPYNTNKDLITHFNSLDKKIDRYTVSEFEEQLKFILSLEIPKSFLNANFKLSRYKEDDPSGINDAVLNLKHLSAHALADINLNKDYELAVDYYKMAIFKYPLETLSGTIATKDVERCLFDISKAYYKAGKKDEAYAYLLGLIIDSDVFYDEAEKKLTTYINDDAVDKIALKEDIDKAIKTIKKAKYNSYSLIFRQNTAYFFPLLSSSVEEYSAEIQKNELYQSLK